MCDWDAAPLFLQERKGSVHKDQRLKPSPGCMSKHDYQDAALYIPVAMMLVWGGHCLHVVAGMSMACQPCGPSAIF